MSMRYEAARIEFCQLAALHDRQLAALEVVPFAVESELISKGVLYLQRHTRNAKESHYQTASFNRRFVGLPKHTPETIHLFGLLGGLAARWLGEGTVLEGCIPSSASEVAESLANLQELQELFDCKVTEWRAQADILRRTILDQYREDLYDANQEEAIPSHVFDIDCEWQMAYEEKLLRLYSPDALLEDAVVVAADCLSALDPAQRPATMEALVRFLGRRCIRVRSKHALPSGVLVQAMLPHLDPASMVYQAVAAFASYSQPLTQSLEIVQSTGKKAAHCLRHLQGSPFESLSIHTQAKWLSSQAVVSSHVDAKALASALQQCGVSPKSATGHKEEEWYDPGRLALLRDIREPNEEDQNSVARSFCVSTSGAWLSLGRGAFALRLAEHLALSTSAGLKASMSDWLVSALEHLGENAPKAVSASGTFIKKMGGSCSERGVQLAVQVLGGQGMAVAKAIVQCARKHVDSHVALFHLQNCDLVKRGAHSVQTEDIFDCRGCGEPVAREGTLCSACEGSDDGAPCHTVAKEDIWRGALESRLQSNLELFPASFSIGVKCLADGGQADRACPQIGEALERILRLVAGRSPCFSCPATGNVASIQKELNKLQFRHNMVLNIQSTPFWHVAGWPTPWAVPDVKKVSGGESGALAALLGKLERAEQAVNALLKKVCFADRLPSLQQDYPTDYDEAGKQPLFRTVSSEQRSTKAMMDAELQIRLLEASADGPKEKKAYNAKYQPRHVQKEKGVHAQKALADKNARKLRERARERNRDGKYSEPKEDELDRGSAAKSKGCEARAGEGKGKSAALKKVNDAPQEKATVIHMEGARGAADAIMLEVEFALSSKHIVSICTLPNEYISDVKRALEVAVGVPAWRQQLLTEDGTPLQDTARLLETGLVQSRRLLVVKKAWTLLCHATWAMDGPIQWLFTPAEVQAIAQGATCVRIQTKGNPQEFVTSKANMYPIEDIRNGVAIGSGRVLEMNDVDKFWESDSPQLMKCLWHEKTLASAPLETTVYCASGNTDGLHWCSCEPLAMRMMCRCMWGRSVRHESGPLELYVDA